MTLVTLT